MSVTVAFVPLAPGAKLGSAALKSAFAELWPHLPAPAVTRSASTVTVDVPDHGSVILGAMPAPIPAESVAYACERSWLWNDPAAALAGHTGHLVVTTMFGPADPLDRAKLLTFGLAVVLHACPQALGVYWCDAGAVIAGGLFKEMATEILPDALPVYLWVNVRVGPGPKGKAAGATTGLAALGHKEFETESCPDTPSELRERLHDIAQYVLTNGPVIGDGHTIGQDATAEIRAKYAASKFGADGGVIRLDWVPATKRR